MHDRGRGVHGRGACMAGGVHAGRACMAGGMCGRGVLHFGSTNPCRITRNVVSNETNEDVRMYT